MAWASSNIDRYIIIHPFWFRGTISDPLYPLQPLPSRLTIGASLGQVDGAADAIRTAAPSWYPCNRALDAVSERAPGVLNSRRSYSMVDIVTLSNRRPMYIVYRLLFHMCSLELLRGLTGGECSPEALLVSVSV